MAWRFAASAVLGVVLLATNASAQDTKQNWAICEGNNVTLDASLAACNALIGSVRNKQDLSYAYLNRGASQRKKGYLDLAVADFTQALVLNKDNMQALVNRAEVNRVRGQTESAKADYWAVTRLQANNAEQFLSRGTAFDRLGNLNDALKDFDQAVKKNPSVLSTKAQALRERGYARSRLGRLDEALADFDQAVAIDQNDALAFLFRAQLRERRDEYEQAIADFTEATLLRSGMDQAWIGRCWAEGESGKNLQRALEDCSVALRRMPPITPRPFAARAFVYYRMGRMDEAITDANAALAVSPQDRAAALFIRGLAERATNRQAEGDADLKAAKAIRANIDRLFANAGVAVPDL